jgi:ADP-Ribosyltransferase in polyvalent proteins
MLVYHGSKELFEVFDYSKIGTNGTMEGKGFYFTDSIGVASGYGDNGYLYTVEFNGKKSLDSEKKTITRQQLKKYLLVLHEETDYLSNWGEVGYEGLEKVLNEAVRGEYEQSDNDVDIISGIANASGNMEVSLSLVYKVLGYDSIVLDAEWGNGQKLYIALTNDIIKIVDVKELKGSKN